RMGSGRSNKALATLSELRRYTNAGGALRLRQQLGELPADNRSRQLRTMGERRRRVMRGLVRGPAVHDPANRLELASRNDEPPCPRLALLRIFSGYSRQHVQNIAGDGARPGKQL